MHLWNDYEGKTIADHYPLTKLLRPEGRSAFFMTVTTDGSAPETIRLTESLNDEAEMLERWHQVAEVHQPNLVRIKTYGQTTFDGVPLTYALMESADSSLTEILQERPLTTAETTEVALAVTAALRALHASHLIHEYVVPASVMACGEIIKLRSDCARPCVPDGEFQPEAACLALRQKDVQDLATLLLECLTLERVWKPTLRLAAPFDTIIPRVLEGRWGLAEITEALTPPVVAPAGPLVPREVLAAATAPKAQILQFPAMAEAPEPDLPVRRPKAAKPSLVNSPVLWATGFAVLLLIVLLAFRSASPRPVASVPVPAPAPVAATKPEAKPSAELAVTPAVAAGWRVVAYTYNNQDQAWKKAGALRQRDSRLNPEVFSPSGGAPWLLTIGGSMARDEAEATLRMARKAGLPRDSFIRYYPARG